MLTSRDFLETDARIICGFPRTPAELFYMFPAAQWPLTPRKLLASARERYESTVVVCDGTVAGYANFISCEPGDYCSLGNVIVNPDVRRQGVGTHLVRTMINKALETYAVRSVRLRCFHANIAGLRLYGTLGFRRTGIVSRRCPDGCIVPVYEFSLGDTPVASPSRLKASA